MTLESPNYFDTDDTNLYEELLKKPSETLTKEQHEFVIKMYHMDELFTESLFMGRGEC